MQWRILDPLALDSMTYDVSDALAGNHATGRINKTDLAPGCSSFADRKAASTYVRGEASVCTAQPRSGSGIGVATPSLVSTAR